MGMIAVVVVDANKDNFDAISSTIIRFGDQKCHAETLIRNSISEYIDFYSFVMENHDQLFIVSYDDIIYDTRKVGEENIFCH